MSTSEESFTISESLRARVFGAVQGLDEPLLDAGQIRSPCTARLDDLDSIVLSHNVTTAEIHGDPGSKSDTSLFNHSYSQIFSQTQEDTASLKKTIDEAPVITRPFAGIENIFDDEALQYDQPTVCKVSRDPSSPVYDARPGEGTVLSTVDHEVDRADQLPVSSALPQKTPLGLTQMFQMSQETPILQTRKSEYVSVRESQKRPSSFSDHEYSDVEEDDPDFPALRRSASVVKRRSTSHSIMNRLREKAVFDHRPVAEKPACREEHGIATVQEDLENEVIPATAPHEEYSSPAFNRPGRDHAIITDSQPRAQKIVPLGQSHAPPIYNVMETISSNNQVKQITDICDATQPQADSSLSSTTDEESLIKSGHRQRPITVKESPVFEAMTSYDLTNSVMRQSDDSHMAQTLIPAPRSTIDYTAIKATQSEQRQEFVDTPKHDFSSPVLHAHERRRSKRAPLISPSPMVSPPIKSNLLDCQNVQKHHIHDEYLDIPSPLQRDSSQSTRDHAGCNARKGPEDGIQPGNISESGSSLGENLVAHEQDEESLAKSTSVAQSSQESVSSPLTSLASEDFVQETSPHHFPLPGTTKWSRRVLALYPETGTYRTGEFLGSVDAADFSSRDTTVHIKYDNSTLHECLLENVRPLDLRIGDVVKVQVRGLRTRRLIIASLTRHAKGVAAEHTDIHGHTIFGGRRQDTNTIDQYSIHEIELPRNLMKPFSGRQFSARWREYLRYSPTPSHKHRRGRSSPLLQCLKIDRVTSPSIAGSATDAGIEADGIFSGIAFSVTIHSNNTNSRKRVEKRIRSNGGLLLESGPEELFEDSAFSDDYDIGPLKLKSSALDLTASIVIADGHSRRAKYLQALSLQIPCVHYTYIDACLAKKKVLDFRPYLLASGEGKLDDTSVLLSMSCLHVSSLTQPHGVSHIVATRRKPLLDKNIIFVVGADEGTREKRAIHLFLAWAMGCNDRTECGTLEEAYRVMTRPVDDKRWDLISVHDWDNDARHTGDHDVDDHIAAIPNPNPNPNHAYNHESHHHKGKRNGAMVSTNTTTGATTTDTAAAPADVAATTGKTLIPGGDLWRNELAGKIMTNEDVVQSLITQRLCLS